MTVEEMEARGQVDGRHVQEMQRLRGDDVSDYLGLMLLCRDNYQAMLQQGQSGAGAYNLALAVAYANGVLSCFD